MRSMVNVVPNIANDSIIADKVMSEISRTLPGRTVVHMKTLYINVSKRQ